MNFHYCAKLLKKKNSHKCAHFYLDFKTLQEKKGSVFNELKMLMIKILHGFNIQNLRM